MKSFGERLKTLRQERGVSQAALGELLGVSERNVRFYENDQRHPDFDGLVALADFFGVSTDYLLGRTDER